MMKCPSCETKNKLQAKFCKNCGAPLKEKKKQKRKYLVTAFIIVFVLCLGIYFAIGKVNEKRYSNTIAEADTYVEQKNYKQAEIAYLNAIDIEPKKAEPYIKLSEVYIAQGKNKEAVSLLKTAEKKITSTADKQKIEKEQKIAESLASYSWDWKIEPTIEADDIFYALTPINGAKNDWKKQIVSPYAAIKKDDKFSLIDMSGTLIDDFIYNDVVSELGNYVLKRIEPKKEKNFPNKAIAYILTDGELVPLGGQGGTGVDVYYFYHNGLHSTVESYSSDTIQPETAIPIQQQDSNAYMFDSGKYAIYHDDKLVSDFIYEDCGSVSDGLLAAKKNGKWGYVNEEGKTVIPFEYDSSWQIKKDSSSTLEPLKKDYTVTNFAYAANDGYVTLVKKGVWELRNVNGDLVIAPGIFEKITPVLDGQCWVKKNGKWGVITIDDHKTKSE